MKTNSIPDRLRTGLTLTTTGAVDQRTGSTARSTGEGFKLYYHGVDRKRKGVGVILKEEYAKIFLGVKRVLDMVICVKREIEGVMMKVVSGFVPHVGCEMKEREEVWRELDKVVESIPGEEREVIGAEFNGHVGEGNREKSLEAQMVFDFA